MPTPADRPSAPDSGANLPNIYLGFLTVRLGSTNRAAERTEDAWADFGLDLDGQCTNSSTCPGVAEPSCAKAGPQLPFDGQLCRDNSLGRLQPVLSAVPELGEKYGLSEDLINCSLWRGSYNTIVRISDYNGKPDDPRVRVDFYGSPGIQEPFSWNCPTADFRKQYPRWRSSRKFAVDQNALTGPIAEEGTLPDSRVADAEAYVREGYLVAQIPDGSEQGFLGDGAPFRGFMYKTQRSVFVGEIYRAQDATWAMRDGLMAGRIAKPDLLKAFREIGFCGADGSESFYTNMITYINEDADLLASGENNPDAVCDAMSFAVGFTASQLVPGTAAEVPPRLECCPPGKTAEQCSAVCGDGMKTGDEACDTAIDAGQPGACPTECAAVDECTPQVLRGSDCSTVCAPKPIVAVGARDGCCPKEAIATVDSDCEPVCGNGLVEAGETCDPAESCEACAESSGCLMARSVGSAENCDQHCELTVIQMCNNGDGCCPAMCNSGNDNDCSSTCGNGMVDEGETCETGGAQQCRANCDDGVACTQDLTTGSPQNCNISCSYTQITQNVTGDGCCPPGATANSDGDCRSDCGNGVIEMGEQCDDGNEVPGDGCVECRPEDEGETCMVKLGASDACTECTCARCGAETLTCYGTGSADDVKRCTDLYECSQSTKCGNPDCWCGEYTLLTCLAGPSNGPCKGVIAAAAGSESLAEISAAGEDPNAPSGRANLLRTCTQQNCARECWDR